MAKFTYVGSFLMAVTLIIGSIYFQHSFLMSFASSSPLIDVARGVVALLMLALIVTFPPRSIALRTVLAMASMGFATWAINYALSGTIALADALLFFHASLSFAVAALEPASYKVIDIEEEDSEERQVEVRMPVKA